MKKRPRRYRCFSQVHVPVFFDFVPYQEFLTASSNIIPSNAGLTSGLGKKSQKHNAGIKFAMNLFAQT